MDWRWLFSSFDGRINRGKFWAGFIILWILSIVANLIISTIFGIRYVEGEVFPAMAPVAWLVWVAAGLAIIYATLAVWAKRWHDRDKSGWWSLIAFVPFIGAIWILVECGCLPGTEGPNRYGPDPLAGGA
jgi:uncharacterized membrane protein YhaH (DUF805 family)